MSQPGLCSLFMQVNEGPLHLWSWHHHCHLHLTDVMSPQVLAKHLLLCQAIPHPSSWSGATCPYMGVFGLLSPTPPAAASHLSPDAARVFQQVLLENFCPLSGFNTFCHTDSFTQGPSLHCQTVTLDNKCRGLIYCCVPVLAGAQ